MRRERRFNKNNMDIKRILYTAGGILSISTITFIAMFLLNSSNIENESIIAKFNTSLIEESNINSTIEETSSQMGKTVNEVQNETVNEIVNELSNEDDTKYAINTSNVEEKKLSEDNATKNETKEEKVKDPEFKKPVEGEILRKYAKDNLVYSTTLDEWITHNGIDIIAPKTTVVKASAEGTVKSIKNDPRYGLTVVIEHANGFSSVYSNLLTAEFVEEGEKVEQGQTIGTVGNTATFEISDESHLHFEILKNSEYVDPELYLK